MCRVRQHSFGKAPKEICLTLALILAFSPWEKEFNAEF